MRREKAKQLLYVLLLVLSWGKGDKVSLIFSVCIMHNILYIGGRIYISSPLWKGGTGLSILYFVLRKCRTSLLILYFVIYSLLDLWRYFVYLRGKRQCYLFL